MGVAKYERINRDDYGEDEDVDQEVELGPRDFGEGSSSLTTSSPSPVNSSLRSSAGKPEYRVRNGGSPGRPTTGSRALLHSLLSTALVILLYFTLSIGLTFYQSNLLEKFHFPLTVVLYHLIIKFTLSAMYRIIYRLVTGRRRVVIDCNSSLKIAPVGFASGVDIGFSNWGLELVQISLYTMTKSTTIVFILIFSILLKLERKSWSLASIVVLISSGLIMFTYKATNFDLLGFMFILIASLSAGIRWSFAQLLMQRSKMGLHHPIDMIYYMQPWMMVAIIPSIAIFEGSTLLANYHLLEESQFQDVYLMFLRVTIGAVLAFGMEVSEFLVLSRTSSLTLSISGVLKEVCQLVLAVKWKGDQLSTVNVLGLVLCLGGIVCHVAHKYSMFTSANERPGTENGDKDEEDDGMGPDDDTESFQFR